MLGHTKRPVSTPTPVAGSPRLVLHFPARPDIEADLRRFAVDEKRCCEFWGFDIVTTDGLAFRWDGPPSTTDIVDRLAGFFLGDEPALDLAGLL